MVFCNLHCTYIDIHIYIYIYKLNDRYMEMHGCKESLHIYTCVKPPWNVWTDGLLHACKTASCSSAYSAYADLSTVGCTKDACKESLHVHMHEDSPQCLSMHCMDS